MAAGDSCTVSCQSGHYVGEDAVYTCPVENVISTTQPVRNSTAPQICQPIIPCGYLTDQGAAFNEADCEAVAAGASCAVSCADGYIGSNTTWTCPAENVAIAGQPIGVLPGCLLPQPCRALVAPGPEYDATGCSSLEPGDSCAVNCASGYAGVSTAFGCSVDNTNTSVQPTGTLPSCAAITSCAALTNLGSAFDVSSCTSVSAGAGCIVNCAAGYTGYGTMYTCPASNTDPNAQPVGALPSCAAVVVGCAALDLSAVDDMSGQYDESTCASTEAGGMCQVTCHSGFVGSPSNFSCLSGNSVSSTQPSGTLPVSFLVELFNRHA